MAKSKYSAERKIAIVEKYLSGEGSYESLSNAYGIDSKTLRAWVAKFKAQGEIGFQERNGNRHYSKEFKIQCVEAVTDEESLRNAIVDYIRFYSIDRIQKRFMGKTPAEVRAEGLVTDTPSQYPIPCKQTDRKVQSPIGCINRDPRTIADPRIQSKNFYLFSWST